jgi:hypothetical protein
MGMARMCYIGKRRPGSKSADLAMEDVSHLRGSVLHPVIRTSSYPCNLKKSYSGSLGITE